MDKKELLDVAIDLFRVVELQIIETEKLRNKAQKLQEKLSRLTQPRYAGSATCGHDVCDVHPIPPFGEQRG